MNSGRKLFWFLNRVELIFCSFMLFFHYKSHNIRHTPIDESFLSLYLPSAILVFGQICFLQPKLDDHAIKIAKNDENVSPLKLHALYVVCEIIKMISLLSIAFQFGSFFFPEQQLF